jgi:opacity protein-like surface antigen
MRVPALAMLTVSAVLTAAPAAAQAYDPKYPVCLQGYGQGGGHRIDCTYATLAQCNATAALAGQCLENPFFAGARQSAGSRSPRPRRAH